MKIRALIVLLTAVVFLGLGSLDRLLIERGHVPLFSSVVISEDGGSEERYSSFFYEAVRVYPQRKLQGPKEMILDVFSDENGFTVTFRWKWLNLLFLALLSLLIHHWVRVIPKLLSSSKSKLEGESI